MVAVTDSSLLTNIPTLTIGQWAKSFENYLVWFKRCCESGIEEPLTSVMVHGVSGVGKSTVIRKICERLGIECRVITASIIDPIDIQGLPDKDDNGTFRYLPLSTLCPTDPKSIGLIVFDELSNADPLRQQAVMPTILERRVGQTYLPIGWLVIALGNTDRDGAHIEGLTGPMANRLLHVEVEYNSKEHVERMIEEGYVGEIVAFINENGDKGHNYTEGAVAWPSPRTIEKVNLLLKEAMERHPNMSLLEIVKNNLTLLPISSAVGLMWEASFKSFLQDQTSLPNVDKIIAGEPIEGHIQLSDTAAWRLATLIRCRLNEMFPDTEHPDWVPDISGGEPSELVKHAIRSCVNAMKFFDQRPYAGEALAVMWAYILRTWSYERKCNARLLRALMQEGVNLNNFGNEHLAEMAQLCERAFNEQA